MIERLKKTVLAGVAGAGLAAGIVFGAAPAAHADVLDDLAGEFSTASGAGQVANLLNQSLKLRSLGIKPTGAELAAITDAMQYRPNQTPLVKALKDTIAGQTKRYQQAKAGANNPGYTVGINQYDPNSPGGVTLGPGGINLGGAPFQIGQPG